MTQGMYPLGRLTPSLVRQEPLFAGAAAPAGTLFVLGDDGGYAAAAITGRELHVGRNTPDVHVAVGRDDAYVSRQHATLRCVDYGAETRWLLRNGGTLPLRIPDTAPILRTQEVLVPAGYTPLYIQGAQLHVVELLVSDGCRQRGTVRPDTNTGNLRLPLTRREWLVLVAMFRDVLTREDQALPLTWNETAKVLNGVPGQCGWTDRKAENVVDGVRQRLTAAGIDRLTRETAPSEALKANLQRVLVDTGTLLPDDLKVLTTGIGD
ncbi:FHA domain-containing protein [Actinophytocola sp.]|uniref:FHA domain-containing protein n=1 Tax=Actinophytocola sp. TaxID=1872138 RepID=UPI002ED5D5E4